MALLLHRALQPPTQLSFTKIITVPSTSPLLLFGKAVERFRKRGRRYTVLWKVRPLRGGMEKLTQSAPFSLQVRGTREAAEEYWRKRCRCEEHHQIQDFEPFWQWKLKLDHMPSFNITVLNSKPAMWSASHSSQSYSETAWHHVFLTFCNFSGSLIIPGFELLYPLNKDVSKRTPHYMDNIRILQSLWNSLPSHLKCKKRLLIFTN